MLLRCRNNINMGRPSSTLQEQTTYVPRTLRCKQRGRGATLMIFPREGGLQSSVVRGDKMR